MGDIGTIIGGAGALLGGGASVASTIAGKNAQDKAQSQLDNLLRTQTSSAEGILKQTSPLRGLTTANLLDVLTGGTNANLGFQAPTREAVESQFKNARENIISTTPNQGGQLNKSLGDLEIARAQTVGGLESDTRKQAFEDALRIGYGVAPSTVFPTFAGSANVLANLSAQGGQQAASGGAGLGQITALGALMSMKSGQK